MTSPEPHPTDSPTPGPTTGPTTGPTRRPLRRAAAAVGAVALAAPFALGVAALGTSVASSTSAGESLTSAPGVVATADRDGYGPPRGRFRGSDGGLPTAPGSPGAASAPTQATDTVDATAEQSVGLALISNTIDYGDAEAAGTGMVISADGLVVTNHHVVADATMLEVTVAETGDTYEASYVGGDATRDIAVLRLVGATGLTPVTLDDDGVAVGETVTSVGDAGGDGGSLTAATGTVTDASTGIDVSNDDGTTSRLRALIEVDADIVPGDSGGALLDTDGEVVGMNVAASSGGRDIVGYAIPVRRVERIATAIVAGEQVGDVVLGYDAFLGVELADASALVAGVLEGTAAAAAGLAAGDTVTAVDGTTVATAEELSAALGRHDAGEVVTISWTTASGQEQQADVELGNAPID